MESAIFIATVFIVKYLQYKNQQWTVKNHSKNSVQN